MRNNHQTPSDNFLIGYFKSIIYALFIKAIIQMYIKDSQHFSSNTRYPSGVLPVFFLQMFCMIGFSVLFAILTLYCTHELHLTDQQAYNITCAFNAQVFALSILGGYLGNRWMGYNLSFIVGACLAIAGYIFLLSTNLNLFHCGLAMFALSQGLMVPSLYLILGNLYCHGDNRRDSGFILAYIGMNVGSLFASMIAGAVSQYYSYHLVLLIGVIFSFLTLIFYFIFQPKKTIVTETPSIISKIMGILIIIIFIPIVMILLDHVKWNNTLLISLGTIIIISLSFIALRNKTREIRKKLLLFLLLSILSIFFWSLYLLAPTILPIFTERNVDRSIFDIIIPAASFSVLNPFFIIILGPLTGWLWLRLAKSNRKISILGKFSLGLLLMGIGYLILAIGILAHNQSGYIFWGWIVLSYFSQTLGELCIGPIGYAMVGELIPPKQEGLMMGVWQLMSGVAGVLTNYFSNFIGKTNNTSPLITNHVYFSTFLLCGGIVVFAGVLAVSIKWLFIIIKRNSDSKFSFCELEQSSD